MDYEPPTKGDIEEWHMQCAALVENYMEANPDSPVTEEEAVRLAYWVVGKLLCDSDHDPDPEDVFEFAFAHATIHSGGDDDWSSEQ